MPIADDEIEARERTRRLFGLLALAVVLVAAIVGLYLGTDSDAAHGVAARFEGFLTAVVARAAIDLAQHPGRRSSRPSSDRPLPPPPSPPPFRREEREDTTARRMRVQRGERKP